MHLRRIELMNFGPYRHQVIDFVPPTTDRHIVLMGGLNGAGKTSMLNAISFGLFGLEDTLFQVKGLDARGADKDTRDSLTKNILNRYAFAAGDRTAQVLLTISDHGSDILIDRTWEFNSNQMLLAEQLCITVNGEIMHGDNSEAYRDFLSARLPPHVGRFFIFDGEEIQRLAKESPAAIVQEGIDKLLGFHLLAQLEKDLDERFKAYRREFRQETAKQQQLDAIEADVRRQNGLISTLEDDITDLEDESQEYRDKLAKLEKSLEGVLGTSGKSRSDLQTEINAAKQKIETQRARIEQHLDCLGCLLPFKLIDQLKHQLTKEENRRQWMAAQKTVQPNLKKLSSEMFGPAAPSPLPPLTDAQRSFLQNLLTERWLDLFHPAPEGVTDTPLHEYLTLGEELPMVLTACVQVFQREGFDLEPILNDIEASTRRVNTLELELSGSAAPPDGDTKQLMQDRDRVNRQIGKNSESRDHKMRQIQAAKHTRADLMSKASTLQNQMARAGELGSLADAASRIKATIHQYQEELRPRKREQLRSHLEQMYRSLARKEGVVHSVTFDESYRIALHDERGGVIPVDTLSAGEREIFALSLLWALAQCYGKDIPIVIDTPLGRLDSKHRSNIVNNYLPKAGTQVIILSTDTEIDSDYFSSLQPYILQTLQFTYDPVMLETTVRDGYFSLK